MHWNDLNARVACRQLGFLTGRRMVASEKDSFVHYDKPIITKYEFVCYGREMALSSCKYRLVYEISNRGSHKNDADIMCSNITGIRFCIV